MIILNFKMCILLALITICAGVSGVPSPSSRIMGGSTVSISNYPSTAALLYTSDYSSYRLVCGSTILNTKNLLTIAACVYGTSSNRYRVRVGSSYANQNGYVYNISSFLCHPSYKSSSFDYDIAILHTTTHMTYIPDAVQPANIANSLYQLEDNDAVWIAGWGRTSTNGAFPDELRHVMLGIVNQTTCSQRYGSGLVTANMLCAGLLDIGGRDACSGDGGGPLYHNSVVVGLSSWGMATCGQAYYPGVYTRVSSFTSWIAANII